MRMFTRTRLQDYISPLTLFGSVHQQQFTLTRAEPQRPTQRQCQKNEFDGAE